jgi:glucose/arabinose dehydrogenase
MFTRVPTAFVLDTRELYGVDNGIDFLGDEEQPEELNHIERRSTVSRRAR